MIYIRNYAGKKENRTDPPVNATPLGLGRGANTLDDRADNVVVVELEDDVDNEDDVADEDDAV